MFSPDGRFIAYTSTEAGGSTWDIYVRPFPGPGGKWRISTTGGIYPAWSATTHELLFANYLDPTPSKCRAAGDPRAGEERHSLLHWRFAGVPAMTSTRETQASRNRLREATAGPPLTSGMTRSSSVVIPSMLTA
jgi:WD40-like Beta Propeller Repeat